MRLAGRLAPLVLGLQRIGALLRVADIVERGGNAGIAGNVEPGDPPVGVDRLLQGGGDVVERQVRVHDGLVDFVGVGRVEFRQARDLVHEVAHLQGGQRVELAEPEGLAGIIGLEEGGAEAVVGERLAVDRLAAEGLVPHPFAARPQLVAARKLRAFGKGRPLHEGGDILALVGEGELARQVGDRLDVIGLQPVVGVDVVGVLADEGADDVHRVDAVGGSRLRDLGAQPCVVLEQRVDLAVFRLESGVGGLGAARRGAGYRRLLGIAVAGRDGRRRRRRQHRRRQRQRQGHTNQFLHAPPRPVRLFCHNLEKARRGVEHCIGA